MKICKIITGRPVGPINVGERALIRQEEGLRRTTPVKYVRRISLGEIRFETQNTKYVLKVVPMCGHAKEENGYEIH